MRKKANGERDTAMGIWKKAHWTNKERKNPLPFYHEAIIFIYIIIIITFIIIINAFIIFISIISKI